MRWPPPLTIAQLLELHPFPAEHASKKRIERLWVFDLPGTPATLWPFISDTSRMNRALGTGADDVRREERPALRQLEGRRRPARVGRGAVELGRRAVADVDAHLRARLHEGDVRDPSPRADRRRARASTCTSARCRATRCARAAIRLGFPSLEKSYRKVLPALAAQLDRLRPDILQLPPPELDEGSQARLRAVREQLLAEKLPRDCVDALVDWVRTGDEADLHRIQIRERARVWKLPELELLRTALHATRAGMLDLSWDTICPHCRGVRDEHEQARGADRRQSLRGVPGRLHDRYARGGRGHVPRASVGPRRRGAAVLQRRARRRRITSA